MCGPARSVQRLSPTARVERPVRDPLPRPICTPGHPMRRLVKVAICGFRSRSRQQQRGNCREIAERIRDSMRLPTATSCLIWLRGQDLNLRPSGYEADFSSIRVMQFNDLQRLPKPKSMSFSHSLGTPNSSSSQSVSAVLTYSRLRFQRHTSGYVARCAVAVAPVIELRINSPAGTMLFCS